MSTKGFYNINDLVTAIATINLTLATLGTAAYLNRGAANGVASLDASSKVPLAQIPDLGLGTAASLNAAVANGAATLDSSGKLTASQIPDSLLSSLSYQGTWDASTNTPNLTTVGPAGHFYVVNVAGTQFTESWVVGDWIVSNGASWDKIPAAVLVTSVQGRTGDVVITLADLGLAGFDPANYTLNTRQVATGSGLTGGGNLTADRTLSVDSTVVRTTGNQSIAGVKTFSDVISGIITTAQNVSRSVIAGNGLTGGGELTANRTLTMGTPSAISAVSTNSVTGTTHTHQLNITAADIGGVSNTRQIATGSGLTGGGDLSANRTLSVDSTVVRTTGDQSIAGVKSFGYLNVTAAFSGAFGAIGVGAITAAVPVNASASWIASAYRSGTHVGGIQIKNDGAEIRFYTGGNYVGFIGNAIYGTGANITGINGSNISAGTVAAARLPSNVVYNSRVINAGNGLTGGGDLSANRTVTLGLPTSITTSSTNSVTSESHTHAFDVTITDLGGVPTARSISAGTHLTGGGDLSANRTLGLAFLVNSWAKDSNNADRMLFGGTADSAQFALRAVGNGSFQFRNSANSTVASISTAGNVSAAGYGVLSDSRLKTDIADYCVTYDSDELKLKSWVWAITDDVPESLRGKFDTGVIADDVERIFPNCIFIDEHGFRRVDYGKLAVHLVLNKGCKQ